MKLNILAAIQRSLEFLRYLALPDLSNSTGIAKLRYIQSIYETPEYLNPDTLVGDLLSPPVRWLSLLQGKIQLSKLQLRPFYYYLIARTKHYDQVFSDAMHGNIECIFNIGCGTDTRAYRFAAELERSEKKIFECDQKQLVCVKQKLAEKRWPINHVRYISIDINDNCWPELESTLDKIHRPVLIMLEGVSAYVREDSFGRFLSLIAAKTSPGSRVAYDYKVSDISDDLDKLDRAKLPFRLPKTKTKAIAYHEALGYSVDRIELSDELSLRFLPNLMLRDASLFTEDGLVELTVTRR